MSGTSPLATKASFKKRLFAFSLDLLFLLGGWAVLGHFFAGDVPRIDLPLIPLVIGLLVPLAIWIFAPCRRGHHNGQTPGMQMVDLKMVTRDGQPLKHNVFASRRIIDTHLS